MWGRRSARAERQCIPQPVKQWLRRFNGVASRYLPNYLGWRWAVDDNRISSPEALLRSALGSAPDLTMT
jgi:hypothetical protein